MTPSLLIFNKTMEDDTLKNQKPSRWVGTKGRNRGGTGEEGWGESKFCECRGRESDAAGLHKHCRKQRHFRRFRVLMERSGRQRWGNKWRD